LVDLGFEKELFEGLFERDEIVYIKNVEIFKKKFQFFCATLKNLNIKN
jgi:hypothetical protein